MSDQVLPVHSPQDDSLILPESDQEEMTLLESAETGSLDQSTPVESEEEESALDEFDDTDDEEILGAEDGQDGTNELTPQKVRRKRRQVRQDAAELRLQGRQAACKRIADIAPDMLKTVKLRVLGRYLQSTRGLEDEELT